MNRLHLVVVLSGCLLSACAASTPEPPLDPSAPKPVAKGADKSRCDYKGRKDRVSLSTSVPGAETANVLRVYATGANSREGRRILRCREVDTNLDGVNDLIRSYNEKGEPLREQADSNYNGRIDTWIDFAGGRVVRAEFDRNGDGKPDEFKVYNAGKLTRLQKDTSFDGRLDTWEVYENGRLNRIGLDLDGDEKVDRWLRDAEVRLREEVAAAKNKDQSPTSAGAQ